ncbi:hypothetical protein HYH03_011304 [Edaphochlamys debaryana]|uniref:HECT-type E3 ubiquitin transferase n=1 Tax=Edaphochlamys debaryana TaxID=47281 RepID=A0A835Y323_9CHLO|nr:hypothetical protein HYH03_011304 [Edaphochlamys debaryana]|eukprot:KAG2490174.1 hypothetical protein HYH03_011304 [Edaphochlamys debaryana]
MFGRGGSALQGLLRKLGAGFEDMMPMGGMSGSRMKAIMQGLRSMDDEGAQLSALSELNELLSISTEDNLAAFPIESMVPLLIQLLNAEHNPDVMLLAARALTFLADVLPQSCGAIVRHGAVPAFCARLLTIEYIDLAEQSLQALEKLSHDHSPSLLQNGGLMAVLSYLDFFPTGVQRTATATAANICRSLTASPGAASSSVAQAAVKEAIPMLTGLLHYSDAKVVDNACVALSYIAEASAGQPALLEALTSGGLVGQALQLIGLSDTGAMTSQLSLSTYYGLLKLLSTAAAASAAGATTLLGAGALATCRTLLATSPLLMTAPGGGGGGGGTLLRTPDQLNEVLGLLTELMPAVQDSQSLVTSGAAVRLPGQAPAPAPASASPTASPGARGGNGGNGGGSTSSASASAARGVELQAYLAAHPQLTQQLCGELLPLVLSAYSATVLSEVRARAIRVLLQLLTACPAAQLREALKDLPLASFLATLLAGRDAATAAAAVHCCEVLMAQLPDVFKHVFLKEGVAHAIEQLAASAPPAAAGGGAAAASTGGGGGSSPPPPPRGAAAPPAEEQRRVTRSSSAVTREDRTAATAAAASAAAAAAATASAAAALAAAAARPPPSSPGGTSLRSALAARAMAFKSAHYGSGCGAPETEGLLQVRSLLKRLPSEPTAALSELLLLLGAPSANAGAGVAGAQGGAGPASVSVFELLNSGAVKALHDFLTGADLPSASGPSAGASPSGEDRATAVLRRVAALTRAGLTPNPAAACSPPLVGLVRKLQAALSNVETLPVHYGRTAPPPPGGGYRSYGGGYGSYGGYGGRSGSAGSAGAPGSLSSGLSMLTHPFKLRLCRHSADSSLRDYSSNIVLIEPLATMSAIEDFLYPRVYRAASAGAAAQPAAAQAAPAAAAAENQAAGAAAGASAGAAAAAAAAAAAVAAGGRKSGAGTGAAAAAAPPARSHPIPVDDGATNRRVTRAQAAQAARAAAEAEEASRRLAGAVRVPTRAGNRRAAGAAAGADDGPAAAAAAAARDHPMPDAGDAEAAAAEAAGGAGRRRTRGRHGDLALAMGVGMDEDDGEESGEGEDAEMEDAEGGRGEGEAEGEAMFDDDDEDFDEEAMDGDEGDGEMGTMHVHDLHMDAAGAAAGAAPAAAAAPGAAAAAAAAAAGARPATAWGARPAAAQGAADGAAAGAAAAGGGGAGAAAAARSAAHQAPPAKMVFCLGDERGSAGLTSATTVFQAIQQLQNQAAAAAGGADDDEGDDEGGAGAAARRGRRLWEEVHTLYYRPTGPGEDPSAAGEGSACRGGAAAPAGPAGPGAASGSGSGSALGRWASTPLRELLTPRVASDLPGATPACREVLALLALLESTNRLGARACAELAAQGAGGPEEAGAGPLESVRHVGRDEFVSAKMSSKLGQQLKDVLSICGGAMPPWCSALAAPCRFLFPFDVRKRYFHATAFGLGRALAHMQAAHAAEAGSGPGAGHGGGDRDGRELRVGRLQRQKVRVSRKRILESAAKVMELYAKSRAVLELEYFNEVGTGLGPTLEFYTLLSHELQRRELGMWRHEERDDTQPPAAPTTATAATDGAVASPQAGTPPAAASPAGAGAKPRSSPNPNRMETDGAPAPAAAPAAAPRAANATVGVSVPSRRDEAAHHDECEYVNAPWGLFPRPLPPAARSSPAGQRLLEHFRLLGRTLGKALQDSRLLDLPLSHVFYALALGTPLDLWDIARFDPGLGATLERLQGALAAHRAAGGAGPLQVDGVALEDLCITFVLPGQPEYELCPGGADTVVSTPEQLEAYVRGVVEATLGEGVAVQMGAFREGFNEVFALSSLSVFHEDELEVLLCGSGERWTLQLLSEAIKFDHGYTQNSQPVRFLLEILSELDAADQRAFLRFVTGCPRLPPGGLTALQPRLTVVRKHPSGGDGPSNGPTPVGSFQEAGAMAGAMCAADADLPSVMTCANYIKLPPYSSKSVMAARLMYAIREGQGSFDLS